MQRQTVVFENDWQAWSRDSFNKHLNRAKQYFKNNDYKNTINYCNKATDLVVVYPDLYGHAYRLCGKAYLKTLQIGKAIKNFNDVFLSLPNDSKANYYLAKAYIAAMKYDQAKQCSKDALTFVHNAKVKNKPLYISQINEVQATIKLARGRYKKALELANMAIKQYHANYQALLIAAKSLYFLGQYDEAISACNRLPDNLGLLVKAKSLFAIKKTDEAILTLMELVTVADNSADYAIAACKLAHAYQKGKGVGVDNDLAQDLFERAIKPLQYYAQQPDQLEIKYHLANAYHYGYGGLAKNINKAKFLYNDIKTNLDPLSQQGGNGLNVRLFRKAKKQLEILNNISSAPKLSNNPNTIYSTRNYAPDSTPTVAPFCLPCKII